MEDKLFYAYLKYQKDSKRNPWSNLLKLHWTVSLPLAISIASTISTLVLSLVSTLSGWNCISVVVMILGYIVLMHTTEIAQIKRSHEKFLEYCEYCSKLKDWLADFSIDSKEKVSIVHGRIIIKINELRKNNSHTAEGVNKWLQRFAIPIVLAVVTAVVSGEDASKEKYTMTFFVVLIFTLVWYLCSIGAKLMNCNSKRKVEQLECFASDLQGILDTQFDGGIAYREKEAKDKGRI